MDKGTPGAVHLRHAGPRRRDGRRRVLACTMRSSARELWHVTIRLYPEGRHEMLNEVNRTEVYATSFRGSNREFEVKRSSLPENLPGGCILSFFLLYSYKFCNHFGLSPVILRKERTQMSKRWALRLLLAVMLLAAFSAAVSGDEGDGWYDASQEEYFWQDQQEVVFPT